MRLGVGVGVGVGGVGLGVGVGLELPPEKLRRITRFTPVAEARGTDLAFRALLVRSG